MIAVVLAAMTATRRFNVRSTADSTAGSSGGPARLSRAVLLVSPHAGTSRKLPRGRAKLRELGVQILDEVDVHHHRRLHDWIQQPRDEPLLVIAAGGDGTVGTAAGYVIGTDAVLGVLPLGTSNDFARSLGIPTDPTRAAQLIAAGEQTDVDIGSFVPDAGAPRYFVHAATVGVNVNFAKLATQVSLRRRLGRLTYLAAGARALRGYRGINCRLEWPGQGHDGRVERWRLVQLSVINAPVFGGFLNLRIPEARLDDGALNIVAVERLSWRSLLGIGAQSVLGTHWPVTGTHLVTVDRLRVSAADQQRLEVALDGEPAGVLPGEFRVAHHGLRVIAPATPST